MAQTNTLSATVVLRPEPRDEQFLMLLGREYSLLYPRTRASETLWGTAATNTPEQRTHLVPCSTLPISAQFSRNVRQNHLQHPQNLRSRLAHQDATKPFRVSCEERSTRLLCSMAKLILFTRKGAKLLFGASTRRRRDRALHARNAHAPGLTPTAQPAPAPHSDCCGIVNHPSAPVRSFHTWGLSQQRRSASGLGLSHPPCPSHPQFGHPPQHLHKTGCAEEARGEMKPRPPTSIGWGTYRPLGGRKRPVAGWCTCVPRTCVSGGAHLVLGGSYRQYRPWSVHCKKLRAFRWRPRFDPATCLRETLDSSFASHQANYSSHASVVCQGYFNGLRCLEQNSSSERPTLCTCSTREGPLTTLVTRLHDTFPYL